jgi:flavodoxin
MANSNRRKNSIDSLLIDGTLSTNWMKISEHNVHFYNELYTKQFNWRPLLDDLSFESIGEAEATWLEREFEEMEALEVVKAMNGDNSVLSSLLGCVESRHYEGFCVCHARGKFQTSLNATMITLIPKILGVVDTFAQLSL